VLAHAIRLRSVRHLGRIQVCSVGDAVRDLEEVVLDHVGAPSEIVVGVAHVDDSTQLETDLVDDEEDLLLVSHEIVAIAVREHELLLQPCQPELVVMDDHRRSEGQSEVEPRNQ